MGSVQGRRNSTIDTAGISGELIPANMSTGKPELRQVPQEDLWPSTLSPIRFLPPCWGRKPQDADDCLAENATVTGESDQNNTLSPGQTTSNNHDTVPPKPWYQNAYSLPVAESGPKDPTWNPQSYLVPSDQLAPPVSQSQEFYERLSLPIHSSPMPNEPDSNTFADSLGLLTENAESNTRKRPRLAEQQQLTLNTNVLTPFSFSPYSFSSNTPSIDFNFSAYSDAPSSCSGFTPQSSVYFSSTPLSPMPSPRRHSDVVRFGTRPKRTSSPRPRPQSSPYSLDVGRRRMSGGSSASFSPYVPSPLVGRKPGNSSSYASPQMRGGPFFPSPMVQGPLQSGNLFVNSGFPGLDQYGHRFAVPEPIASQRIPRTLRSDVDPDQTYFEDYSGLSDPPDLLGPLKDTPLSPPPEDMMPSDPTMVPHEQDLRFENDLYTPKWVRGHGNKREGWCGICKPGRWLVLKNSAFWYDKSFTHGVSAVTGQAFAAPKEIRRTEGSANIWEGLCGNCGQWVGLVTSKKKGTTWFRHAYKCHNHYKPDDSHKRPRDNEEPRGISTVEAYSKSPQCVATSKPESVALGYVNKESLNGPQGVSSIQSMLSII
ncbi:conserved hypothetical protein [Coccidioides posadasii str. Silveira]|uniref:Transcription regulator Rua1 C-terminal domain-containing protein n=1 Tax=Coccidioides posadasii (strain RMSCC 757 / Silveira) TaxID=443226 RepID=E9CZY8_COCPS|nr:conserved hypothetical protein [Coccidioides posadasii str. Silveira]